jgi:regulatory protein YycI of two-component signal transduction system YycFG
MDWNKTKTIFIVIFFILDLFLARQFMVKREANQLEMISERTGEELLQEANITFKESPSSNQKAGYIKAYVHTFTEKETSSLKDQKIEVQEDGKEIHGEFTKPTSLPTSDEKNKLEDFVKKNMINGDQYKLVQVDKEGGQITFAQLYSQKPVYDNTKTFITIQLNEKNEMVSYKQRMLEQFEQRTEAETVKTPVNAVTELYDSNKVNQGSKVRMDLGYYAYFPPATDSQILAPTWRVTVDKDKGEVEVYYVTALD